MDTSTPEPGFRGKFRGPGYRGVFPWGLFWAPFHKTLVPFLAFWGPLSTKLWCFSDAFHRLLWGPGGLSRGRVGAFQGSEGSSGELSRAVINPAGHFVDMHMLSCNPGGHSG